MHRSSRTAFRILACMLGGLAVVLLVTGFDSWWFPLPMVATFAFLGFVRLGPDVDDDEAEPERSRT